jgi:hypothetical protein
VRKAGGITNTKGGKRNNPRNPKPREIPIRNGIKRKRIKMFDKLIQELRDLRLVCDLKLKADDIDMLDRSELGALFRARDLSGELADALFLIATAFYKNKILA